MAKQPAYDSYSPDNIKCLHEIVIDIITLAEWSFYKARQEFVLLIEDECNTAEIYIILEIIRPMLDGPQKIMLDKLFESIHGPVSASPQPSIQFIKQERQRELDKQSQHQYNPAGYYSTSLC